MVMEDNEQPLAPIMGASAPQVVERPLWVLSRDEQRVLIITFVGGLASIVAGAIFIAAAIALGRIYGHWNPSLPWSAGGLLALLIVGFLAGPLTRQAFRDKQPGKPFANALRRLAQVVLGTVFLIIVLQVLALIGLAAGLH